MLYGKLINGEIEYLQRPPHILGDYSKYAIENGYMEIVDWAPDYTDVDHTEILDPYWYIENGKIYRGFLKRNKTEDELKTDRLSRIPDSISKVNLLIGLFDVYEIIPDQIISDIDKIEDIKLKMKLNIEFKYSNYININGELSEFIKTQYSIGKVEYEDLFINMKDK